MLWVYNYLQFCLSYCPSLSTQFYSLSFTGVQYQYLNRYVIVLSQKNHKFLNKFIYFWLAFESYGVPCRFNIFLSHHEGNRLHKCPIELKPGFQRRYVDIFVLFESPESADLSHEYMSSKHQNITSPLNQEVLVHLRFQMSKFVVKTVNLSLIFTENQHLKGFSPITKVPFQRNVPKERTHYFVGVLAYVVIPRHFILKLII